MGDSIGNELEWQTRKQRIDPRLVVQGMVNQVYRLIKSGVAPRMLFLVDRRALAAQAVRSFASFEPEPGLKFDQIYEVYSQRFQRRDFEDDEPFDPKVLPTRYLTDPQPGHAFVYVCTIQRMAINLFGRGAICRKDEPVDEDADQLKIPLHAFDVVIADECHRGYTTAELSVWRNTLDHFDAIKIGLTATPAQHTKAYFKDVVYRYGYERAVREGYLVDYDAVAIRSNCRIEGMFLEEGEAVGLVDADTGAEQMDALEDEREYDVTEIEKKATSIDSNEKIIREVAKYAKEHEEQFGRFPKTLIFAVNDLPHTSHADQIVDLCRDVFNKGDAFVQKITGTVDRPLQRIREFRNRPLPGVVVSVDLMSTGVDIPDLEFIVFLRPVKSRILWEQMLGRGTRRGEKHPDKSKFVVFDCFDGTLLKYFREASAFTKDPPDTPTRTIAEIIEAIWRNVDRDYNTRLLVRRLQRLDKLMSPEARDLFSHYLPDGDMARFARELPGALERDFTGTMKLLRDPSFQALLVNFPRAKRVFVRAYDHEDEVSSEWIIRDGTGKEHQPEDYLTAFYEFVRANPDHIEAIEILLDRPQEWNPQALKELRQKLTVTPLHFTEANLQKAHAARYQKSLADIISMVKHAANEEEQLYTAEDRVDRALAMLTRRKEFTEEQQQWLGRIREHLVTNLSIDREDFEAMPVFTRHGGWGKASQVFGRRLAAMIEEVNAALAA